MDSALNIQRGYADTEIKDNGEFEPKSYRPNSV